MYNYAMGRRGSKPFIESCVARIEQGSYDELPAQLAVNIVVTLNLLGKNDTDAFRRFSEMAKAQKDDLTKEERLIMHDAYA